MNRIGFIGLGKMGSAIIKHLIEQGVDVVTFNRTEGKIDQLIAQDQSSEIKVQNKGTILKAKELVDLVKQLETPRIIWLMIPQGDPVTQMINKLLDAGIEKGDTIVDGGNCFYKDSIRHYNDLKQRGIHYLDVGTSGGIEGARNGACLMIGGEKDVYEKLVPLFEKLAVKDGYAYFGPAGAGHFVKMVHNGVEYGMLQAIGEGFELLQKGPYQLDLYKTASNWTHGSVVRGWLMELLERVLKDKKGLEAVEGIVGGGTTGKWAVETAKELDVETPVLQSALHARASSKNYPTFAGKIIAALRNQFGGHPTTENSLQ